MVMQIYFPHSIQTHPNSFPGTSPNDCAKDWAPPGVKQRSGKGRRIRKVSLDDMKPPQKSCYNSNWPDIHGHYREAKVFFKRSLKVSVSIINYNFLRNQQNVIKRNSQKWVKNYKTILV